MVVTLLLGPVDFSDSSWGKRNLLYLGSVSIYCQFNTNSSVFWRTNKFRESVKMLPGITYKEILAVLFNYPTMPVWLRSSPISTWSKCLWTTYGQWYLFENDNFEIHLTITDRLLSLLFLPQSNIFCSFMEHFSCHRSQSFWFSGFLCNLHYHS